MENGKTYTVMDLAAAVGVPRTTINDWLTKYSMYISSNIQGRRKVYTENTVTVLKEISELRASGLSSAEIEKKLAENHPIQAEPAAEPQEKLGPSGSAEPAAEKKEGTEENGNIYAVAAPTVEKDDFMKMMENMALLSARLHEEELKRSRSLKLYTGLLLVIFIVLTLGFAGIYQYLKKLVSANESLRNAGIKTASELAEVREKAAALTAESAGFQKNVKLLEKELAEQRKTFDKTIQDSLKESRRLVKEEQDRGRKLLSESEAKLALERDKFASERLKLVKALEEAQKKSVEKTDKAPKK